MARRMNLARPVTDKPEERVGDRIPHRETKHRDPTGTKNPAKLAQRSLELSHVLENTQTDKRIERRILERHLEQRRVTKISRQPQLRHHLANRTRLAVHVDTNQPSRPPRKLRKKNPRPVSNLQKLLVHTRTKQINRQPKSSLVDPRRERLVVVVDRIIRSRLPHQRPRRQNQPRPRNLRRHPHHLYHSDRLAGPGYRPRELHPSGQPEILAAARAHPGPAAGLGARSPRLLPLDLAAYAGRGCSAVDAARHAPG